MQTFTPDSIVTVFHIDRSTGFFQDINTLLIALQGVAVASELLVSGVVQHEPGDYITIEAKYLGARVRLPFVNQIQSAVNNRLSDAIEITVLSGREKERQYKHVTSGLADFANSICLPFMLAYHERFIGEIRERYTNRRPAWPSSWQMSWAVRNAASHNGRVFDKANQQAVVWRGLEFSPTDEQQIPLLALLSGADVLILMIEMEQVRTRGKFKHTFDSNASN